MEGRRHIPPRLTVLTLGVRDFEAMRRFYDSLGWPSRTVGDEWVGYETTNAMLALYPLDALAGEANMKAQERDAFPGFTLAVNVESEEMVDEGIEAAREAGARIPSEPVQREWGGKSGYFADPEGNVWEIAFAPGSTFDEHGNMLRLQ